MNNEYSRTSFDWLNENSRLFLERGYLKDGQTPEERYKEISDTAEKFLKIKGFSDKFYDYLGKGYYSLSSPIISNFGNKKGLPISCNGSFVDDSVNSILEKVAELGSMTKHGAGTSIFMGEVRPRGSLISIGGKSFGSVHFLELFESVVNVISQSNIRRGSCAAYLPVEHEDIKEFLKIKSEGHPIQHLSIGVTITDKWMNEMIEGDKEKRSLWAKIIQRRFESGYPYIFFTDTVNKNAPQVYKDKGLKISASNLCVSPETLLLTKNGNKIISTLHGQSVEVWNGKNWSIAKVSKTGENQKLIKVILKNGQSLDCTPYHKFYVDLDNWIIGSNNNKPSDIVETRAKDLKSGDKIRIYHINYTNSYSYTSLCEVEDVIDLGRNDDTYCVNEPIEHKAVFNGILTGNCSEITLHSSSKESFVCNLSSMNILHWDEWKNTDAVETLTYFLDAVMSEYIEKTNDMQFMKAANNFAKNQRALGIGTLGWHSYLQYKMIAFESMDAKFLNCKIHKFIMEKSHYASQTMAEKYGEPELLKGYKMRNITTCAIAPTTSSSFILGQVSPSIEPLNSNYFTKDLAKGKFTYKNPYLKELLIKKNKDTLEVWKSILVKGGSVQHLDFLNQEEKDVFKTFGEISQKEIVIQAAQRQKYIDQSQSLNLMIPHNTSPKDVSQLMIEAWKLGIKTLYYQRSTNPAQELSRSILECKSCEA